MPKCLKPVKNAYRASIRTDSPPTYFNSYLILLNDYWLHNVCEGEFIHLHSVISLSDSHSFLANNRHKMKGNKTANQRTPNTSVKMQQVREQMKKIYKKKASTHQRWIICI